MKYIVLFVGILAFPLFAGAHDGSEYIFVEPQVTSYEAGREIMTEVRIHAPEPITSFRIHLRYDPAFLEVQEITPNTDTVPFWWSQEARDGIVELQGSAPSPGIAGEVLVAGVKVLAKQGGGALFALDESESLLLNARDENVLTAQAAAGVPADQERSTAGFAGMQLIIGAIVLGLVILGVFLLLRGRKQQPV